MSFFKNLFGPGKTPENKNDEPAPAGPAADDPLPCIGAENTLWGVRMLDLRPVTMTMISTSTDPQMATNAVSYGGEDGRVFWDQRPAVDKTIMTGVSFPVEGRLMPGVLFIPNTMEHKWAIYFDGSALRFVRSWLRQVFVVASVLQHENVLTVVKIEGEFTPNEDPEFTAAVLNFLLISHNLGEVSPAPLPKELEGDTRKAGLWAFSAYGNKALVGTFDPQFRVGSEKPLRSHSLLHIAVAKAALAEIERLVKEGYFIDGLAADGLAPLHWSIAQDTMPMEKLLELGADPNVRSAEGATPIMNAVQSAKIVHFQLLIAAGADVNARDGRGFTALHRAAEMGRESMVEALLHGGADKAISADGHTALSFARAQGHARIVEMLE